MKSGHINLAWLLAGLSVILAGCASLPSSESTPEIGPESGSRAVSDTHVQRLEDIDSVFEKSVSTLVGRNRFAQFQDAIAVSASPDGSVFVIDEGASSIIRLNAAAEIIGTYGGAGRKSGQVLEPLDVDARSGLFFSIADAGNGRIQRFTRDGAFVESIPIPDVDGSGRSQPLFPRFQISDAGFQQGASRPVRVVEMASNELVVLDEASRLVLKTDRLHENVRVIGGVNSGPGRIIAPKAIASAEHVLVIVDEVRAEIMLYDEFGSFRTSSNIDVDDLLNIELFNSEIWVLYSRRIDVFSREGVPVRRFYFDGSDNAVDLAISRDYVWILFGKRLSRFDRSLNND